MQFCYDKIHFLPFFFDEENISKDIYNHYYYNNFIVFLWKKWTYGDRKKMNMNMNMVMERKEENKYEYGYGKEGRK